MQENFRALTSLRFVAALAVVLYHYAALVSGFGNLPQPLTRLVFSGTSALEFFYILSGFVLTHAYGNRALNQERSGVRNFWFARFARLYPTYLFAFLLFLPIAWKKYLRPDPTISADLTTFAMGGLTSLFALQSWTPLSQAWNGPSWSLSVEALFYLMFPFVLPHLVRMQAARLLALLTAIYMGMLALVWAHQHSYISEANWHSWFMYNPLFWVPMFLLGMAAYRLRAAWNRVSPQAASLATLTALLLLVAICSTQPTPIMEYCIRGGMGPLFAFLILAFSHSGSGLVEFAGNRWLYALGNASYVLYIVQAPLWHGWRFIIEKITGAQGEAHVSLWLFSSYLVLLIAFSLAAHKVIELPCQRALLSWRKRRRLREREQGVGELSPSAKLR